jgi:hypothetical protein
LVTGSRSWVDADAVYRALFATRMRANIGEQVTVVHGHCPTGADHFADEWATQCVDPDVMVERHPADWSRGKKAGPERNQRMVDAGADVCLAFPLPTSRGTWHCMRAAERAGIPVQVIQP